ncbi:uncharacterized protein SPPG_09520 [Spizellomyces punctatus DAOM BR117]|uniref:Uncharacterized protein n=1 Tax=Spizellomyces punctatus (strain DAOM BR117) TaxID=645134 RepID=A0A0L0H6D2_SPIPD|nr:uncharacterized protein SPPG_09520 [Spizellomyces punctatus DAOM BR117]KNC96466.1 hypothetical protein SPPG_09520 [Spizellomyces punctatus DAOM BR117]|eukprot:XP_016604506.1 hypothetical protein SPPG_09520 [Spizellomyces punctatus DAOM BR117]
MYRSGQNIHPHLTGPLFERRRVTLTDSEGRPSPLHLTSFCRRPLVHPSILRCSLIRTMTPSPDDAGPLPLVYMSRFHKQIVRLFRIPRLSFARVTLIHRHASPIIEMRLLNRLHVTVDARFAP